MNISCMLLVLATSWPRDARTASLTARCAGETSRSMLLLPITALVKSCNWYASSLVVSGEASAANAALVMSQLFGGDFDRLVPTGLVDAIPVADPWVE